MLQALSGIRCCFPAGKSGKCQSPWSNRPWQMSPALPTQSNLLLESCVLAFVLGMGSLAGLDVPATCWKIGTRWQRQKNVQGKMAQDESPSVLRSEDQLCY